MHFKLSRRKILNEYNTFTKFYEENNIYRQNFCNKKGVLTFEQILKRGLGRFIIDEQQEEYKQALLDKQEQIIKEINKHE